MNTKNTVLSIGWKLLAGENCVNFADDFLDFLDGLNCSCVGITPWFEERFRGYVYSVKVEEELTEEKAALIHAWFTQDQRLEQYETLPLDQLWEDE